MEVKRRNKMILFVNVMISTAIIIYLIHNLNINDLKNLAPKLQFRYLIISFTSFLIMPFLGALRWIVALNAKFDLRLITELTKIFWASIAINQVIPSSVGGDLFRIFYLRRSGEGIIKSVASIISERVCMVLWLFFLLSVLLLGYQEKNEIELKTIVAIVGILAFIVLAFMYYFYNKNLFKIFLEKIGLSQIYKYEYIIQILSHMKATDYKLLCILSALSYLNIFISGYAIILGIGQFILPHIFLFGLLAGFAASLLPISFGGWGVRELTVVGIISSSIGQGDAIAYSMVYGFFILLSGLPGVWYIFKRDKAVLKFD